MRPPVSVTAPSVTENRVDVINPAVDGRLLVAVPDNAMLARLAPAVRDTVELVQWFPGEPALERDIDLLVIPYIVNYELLAHVGAVRIIQSQSLGFDGAEKFVPAGVLFCNAVGVHEAPTAELAVTLILMSQRGWPQVGFNQHAGRWEQIAYPGLIGCRVLLIGVGGIGSRVEHRLQGFETALTKVGRTARTGVHGRQELPELLPNADIVILAVPLTDETRGLVDGAFLDLLPKGALVVNVSRGAVIQTDALTERVRNGTIRSALDVVDPEPLPPGHPLWSLPGSLLSPHLGGNVQSMSARIDPLIIEQIDRLARGLKPRFVVIR